MNEAPKGTCPNCKCPVGLTDVVCVGCGFDFRTGKILEVRQDESTPDEGTDVKPTVVEVLLDVFQGLCQVRTFVMGVLACILGAAIMTMGFVLVFGLGGMFLGATIAAAGLIVYAQGIAWFMASDLSLLTEVLAEFNETQWGVFLFLALGSLFGGLALVRCLAAGAG